MVWAFIISTTFLLVAAGRAMVLSRINNTLLQTLLWRGKEGKIDPRKQDFFLVSVYYVGEDDLMGAYMVETPAQLEALKNQFQTLGWRVKVSAFSPNRSMPTLKIKQH